MHDRMQTYTKEELNRIHHASMDILGNTGIAFNESESLEIFKKNGFKVDGNIVFFKEKDIFRALETAPSRFKVAARNPKKSVHLGENDWVFVSTYGAPFICSRTGEKSPATMQDYDNICKLVQTSKFVDMNGFKHVQPTDIPPQTAYLDMLLSNMVLSDKPYMGSTDSRQAARDSIEMAAILFGGKEKLNEMPVMVSLINSLSPLQYAEEMAGSILELARHRQPMVIANMIMAGTTGPVRLPGLLALMNAEILAGLTLAQLAGPGTPVIYGTTSCPTNMKSIVASVGSPEAAIIASAAIQLARYYKLPCRSGGSLTDALVPDGQAMAEGSLLLTTSVQNGAHFILHACGMIGTYIGMNLEKWLIDEELCGMIRRMLTSVDVTEETIDVESIKAVGIGGSYLMEPATLKHFRTEFFMNDLFSKQDHNSWSRKGSRRVEESAADLLLKRLSAYEKPDIDPAMEADLANFVMQRKNKKKSH